jgi:uncharacterized protein DUF6627
MTARGDQPLWLRVSLSSSKNSQIGKEDIMLLKRPLYLYIAASIAFTGFAQTASATLVSAEQVAQVSTARPAGAADAHARIAAALNRPEVQAELMRQGVDPAAAQERVAALSDEDAVRLASHIETAPAGGNIIGVILLVFFVLLITDIIGWTKVFPFTRSMR